MSKGIMTQSIDDGLDITVGIVKERDKYRKGLERATNQMNHFADCPSYTWSWQNKQKKKEDCKDWCDNKDETASACWMEYFLREKE